MGVGYTHRIPDQTQFPHRSPVSFSPIYIKSLTNALTPKRPPNLAKGWSFLIYVGIKGG